MYKKEELRGIIRQIKKRRIPREVIDLTTGNSNELDKFLAKLLIISGRYFYSSPKRVFDNSCLYVIINILLPGSPNSNGLYMEVYLNKRGLTDKLLFDPKNSIEEDFIKMLIDNNIEGINRIK
jgi:hypothetical protein